MSEQELQALLARVAALEEKNAELESKFGELENQVDTVNKFVSAITESQSLENTMNEIESVTKQLTNCDKATFYCYDNTNDKFFSHGDYRNWHSKQNAEELKNAFENKDILSDSKEAVIPLVSSGGKSVGVIVAEKSEGFTPADYNNFRQGCQIVNTVELALKKEFEHQGRITDELTHLKNRQGLNEYLSNTMCGNLNDGQTVNIIMCDIDHFKNVNDTYGHDAGDIILKGVADVLQEGTRAGADCAFRMGGEEMVCIINSEPEAAMDIAERLRSAIENTVHNIQHEGKPLDVKVTVSMGVHTMDPKGAVTPENARNVFDKEFKQADKAVYDAKESGRNRVVNNNELTNLKYLALKAAEVMCGDNKDQNMVDEMKKFAITCLTNEDKEQNHNTVIEALKGVAEQNPAIADAANKIADKIAEKFPDAEKAPEKAVKFFNKNEYKNIQNKAYINTDSKTGFNITQKAQKEGVTISAKFSEGKATITLDAVKDKAFIDAVEGIGKWAEKVQIKYAEKHPDKTQENNKNKDNNAR